MSKQILTKKILCSILAASAFTFVSNQYTEAASVQNVKADNEITIDENNKTTNLNGNNITFTEKDGPKTTTVQGTGVETITFTGSGENGSYTTNDILTAGNNVTYNIDNVNKIIIYGGNNPNSNGLFYTAADGNINFTNIGSLETSDKMLENGNNRGIFHAQAGDIKVEADNISLKQKSGDVLIAQRLGSAAGSITMISKNNIDIYSPNDIGVEILNDYDHSAEAHEKPSKIDLSANNINIYGGYAAVAAYSVHNPHYYANNYLSIKADNEVNITSPKYAIFNQNDDLSYNKIDNGIFIDAKTINISGKIENEENGRISIGSDKTENLMINGPINNSAGNVDIQGNNLSLTGNISATSNSKINLNGNTTFDGDKTKFTTDTTGTINLAGGNMSGVLNITEGSVNLNGATFTTNNIADDITGNGKLVLKDNGMLVTTANQIFKDGNTLGTGEDNSISNTASQKITFESGTVNLTDEKYTLDYLKSAVNAMGNYVYADGENSNTSIVMSGNLISEMGANNVTVDEASSIGDEVALDKVTVNANGTNLLVGADYTVNSDVAGINSINQSVANGFNAGSLNLGTSSTGIVITNDKNVTLGGSQGGNIITVGKNESTNDTFKVVVGLGNGDNINGVTNKKGSFTIGNALATDTTAYTLNGNVVVNDNSKLTTNGQTEITGDVTLNNGTVTVNKGTLTVENINVGTSGVINSNEMSGNITGNVKADTLNLNTNKLSIGNADNAGDLTVKNTKLDGGTVFLDPVWENGSTINDASAMAVVNTNNNSIDGNYVVGQNSILGFGVENTDILRNNFAKTGLIWGKNNITAALYIAGNQTLETNKGAITIDGNKTNNNQSTTLSSNFNAAANSVTMVDGQKIKGNNAALSGVNSVDIDKDAKLYIDEAKKGETYKILKGSSIKSTDVWKNNNIISNNALLVFKGETGVGSDYYNVTASYDTVDNIYGAGNVVISDVIDNTLAKKDEGDKAYDFFNKAANNKINATKEMQVSALNSLANMGELASVNHGTYSMSNVMTDAIADHVKDDKNTGNNLWARYIHNKEDINGISLGGMKADYDATFNGIIVGSDFAKTEKSTTGISFAYAEGDIKGNTLASRTENDADYYGLSVYHQIKNNDGSSVLGDISYMHSSNDVTQYNSGETITASPDADAFSIGIRAQKDVNVGEGTLSPYAGIRYMHLGTGDYTNSLGMNYDVEDQNLWLLPVGVSYSTELKHNDWTIKPMAEVGYVWTMGDRQTDQTVSLYGVTDSFGFDVADSGSFFGKLGITAENDKMAYGIGYQYQKGDTVDANQWIANVEFKF